MKTIVVKRRRNGTETVFINEFIQFANFFGFENEQYGEIIDSMIDEKLIKKAQVVLLSPDRIYDKH